MGSEIKDPGIGTQFQQNTKRIINPDGTYNIIKKGSRKGFRDFFKYMLDISWLRFFLILFLSYILLNIFFTLLYILAGNAAIDGIRSDGAHPILQTFYFSVQTFTTVGYGSLSPVGVFAQSVATVEAFVGFLSFSLATGLGFMKIFGPNEEGVVEFDINNINDIADDEI
jgi:inward rectifier potassium channel